MTKGGSSKPKTLGRLIFGEKRKQHGSPSRHRSSTRTGGSVVDLSSSANVGTKKSSLNIHDWAVWRTQLNEQMAVGMNERRTDLKQMRQYLQSNPFYQQHSRDPSSGRYTGVRLLFSIPHAKLKPEFLDGPRGGIPKTNNSEVVDTPVYDQNRVRSNSDDRTTTSVNSISTAPPIIIDKTISQLLPKGLAGNTAGFLQTNEQMVATDGMRTRRTTRSSYTASDRIHLTLQKAVKDGNVLEKIKAFEMQAAAAQAESSTKLVSSLNHRMPSFAHRTLSPVIIHPISPIPVQQQPQPVRSSRGRHVHPVQQRRDGPIVGHESKKGAHVLEPALGDIILKRRTSSQITVNDEDNSITAISSIALTPSQGHHRNHHHHSYHRRTSTSRSRHRQEIVHEKRTPSNHENLSHKQKQKGTITPSSKSSTRRRWLKGRKETPTENPIQQEIPIIKSSKNKKKNIEQVTTPLVPKEKSSLSSDNNRVYGVPNLNDQTKIEEESESDPERNNIENTNTYISTTKEDDLSRQSKEGDTIITPTAIKTPRRANKKHHHSTDGEILSKFDEDTRFSRPTDDHAHHSELNDDEDRSEGDVFIDELPTVTITRHQSVLNLPNNESRRLQQQTNAIRRHASQCSADQFTSDRRFQRSKENAEIINTNTLKKKQPPITIITRKNKINQDEQIVYEAPHSEQIQAPVCNSHTLKKKRPFHTIDTIGSSSSSNNTLGQNNNKQISKQILHAIMNSIDNNREKSAIAATTEEFFEDRPEEIVVNVTTSA